jgi:predicted ArsR family transcriptional regulator
LLRNILPRVRTAPAVTDAKRRLADELKRLGTATAPQLAAALVLTDTAVRQHLDALEAAGLVARVDPPAEAERARGRPPARYRLTELANTLFPDRHADLAVELIEQVRATLGPAALDAVIDARTSAQEEVYARAMPGGTRVSLRARAERLAELRSAEGYVAEVIPAERGSVLLVEHHCPICEAATTCQGFCRGELELFRRVLGPTVTVERTEHLLSGDLRCAYRISRA